MIKTLPPTNGRTYAQSTPTNLQSRNDPIDTNASKYNYNKTSSIGIDRGIDRTAADRVGASKVTGSKVSNAEFFQGIPSKKTCNQHQDEEILYFCFDCKCECICPECVIHGTGFIDVGKHKDHDVKTVRKSQPIVKAEIDNYLDQFQNNIQSLLIRKSQV